MDPKAYRLPQHVRPKRYDIELDTRLGVPEFTGRVSITLDLGEPCDLIELHARDLRLFEAQLDGDGQTHPGDVTLDAERETATIKFGKPLPTGSATLHLRFVGQLSRGMEGLYLASDGPEQVICTQFQATDARAAFPCFDEPTFKARFAFTITTAADATVLSNGPVVAVTPSQNGRSQTWCFAPTKPMSSYLAALVIGDLAGTAEETVHGTPLRVWALRGKEHMGQFAQQYAARLLPWYETYFDVPYHFDKYDQVAVPGFSSGAMENSGLVLFRQTGLLVDPQTTSWEQEKYIAHIVAHEFAHMWFGNLVTMQWWDDLWLNEAFAEWVSMKAVSLLSPDYAIWDDFQSSKSGALATDALETTHPIYSPVATAAEANELFDTITYVKGCSVLRMLEHFLGEPAFRAGVRTYMREFAERNTVGADLWRHLQEASREPIAQIMQSWITQSGHPLIDVALNPDSHSLHLRQERFFSSPAAMSAAAQTWTIPLVLRFEDAAGVHELRQLLDTPETRIALDVQGTIKWCYANADEIGFYRQRLDGQLLAQVLANLAQLTTSEQMGLLRDQWALTRRGDQAITQFLDVLAAMGASDKYHVLSQVVTYLHTLEDLIVETGDEPTLQRFRAWVSRQYGPKLAASGLAPKPGETRNIAQQRIALLDALVTVAHDAAILDQATQWADCEAADPAAVDPNLAPLFIRAAAQFGDEARFERYVHLYQQRRAAGAGPHQTNRYLQSFPHFRSPELVRRTLQLIEQQIVPQEGVGGLLAGMLNRKHTQLAAWNYIKEHWAVVHALGALWIGGLVQATGQLPVTLRQDVVAFFDAHLNGEAQMSYARALEAMDQLAEFKTRTRDDLIAWFAQQDKP